MVRREKYCHESWVAVHERFLVRTIRGKFDPADSISYKTRANRDFGILTGSGNDSAIIAQLLP
jgi:hypothetical protein